MSGDRPATMWKRLSRCNHNVRSLLGALQALRTDAATRGSVDRVFCIDSFDLIEYLELEFHPAEFDAAQVEDRVRMAALAEYFQAPPGKTILFPWYFDEVDKKLSLSAVEGAVGRWEDRAQQLVANQLKETPILVRDFRKGKNKAEDFVQECGKLLKEVEYPLRLVYAKEGMAHRLQSLFDRGRLVGLADALNFEEEVTIRLGPVYRQAQRWLRRVPGRAEDTESNANDALALQAVYQLNQGRPKTQVVLFSSSWAVDTVIERIYSSYLRERGERIAYRGYWFWAMWFSIALRSPNNHPSRDEIERVNKEFNGPLQRLRRAFDPLTSRASSDSKMFEEDSEIREEAETYVADFEDLLRNLFEPLLDQRGALGIVADRLDPLVQNPAVTSFLERVRWLASELQTGLARDVRRIGEQLKRLTQELQEIVADVGRRHGEVASAVRENAEKSGVATSRRTEMSPRALSLIEKIDQGDSTALSATPGDHSESEIDEIVLAARLAAAREGSRVDLSSHVAALESFPSDPEAILASALISLSESRWEQGIEKLELLVTRRAHTRDLVHLARALLDRSRRRREEEDLESAVEFARRASRRRRGNAAEELWANLEFLDLLVAERSELESDEARSRAVEELGSQIEVEIELPEHLVNRAVEMLIRLRRR